MNLSNPPCFNRLCLDVCLCLLDCLPGAVCLALPAWRCLPACLQATDDAGGERYELHPDGNSLDFFQGLVRKKLPQ